MLELFKHLNRISGVSADECGLGCMQADLQQVASLVDLLDVFVGKNAAGPLQLALALSGSSWDDSFMQTGRKEDVKH